MVGVHFDIGFKSGSFYPDFDICQGNTGSFK